MNKDSWGEIINGEETFKEMIGYYDWLKEVIEIMQKENKELHNKIDKAIEYIGSQKYFDCNYNPEDPFEWQRPKNDLLEILKDSDVDE